MLEDVLTIIGAISFFCFVVIFVYAGLCYFLPSTPARAEEKVINNWALCPRCGALNNDNFPLWHLPTNKVIAGGCEECWQDGAGAHFDEALGSVSKWERRKL